MTDTQWKVYDFIRNFIKRNEKSPTVREIAETFNRTPSTIHMHLVKLKEKGFIDFDGQKRNIKILIDGVK